MKGRGGGAAGAKNGAGRADEKRWGKNDGERKKEVRGVEGKSWGGRRSFILDAFLERNNVILLSGGLVCCPYQQLCGSHGSRTF